MPQHCQEEEYTIHGETIAVCVHRKGTTCSDPVGCRHILVRYQGVGQPVLVPGDLGRYPFLAVGAPESMDLSCGSTWHDAGRAENRTKAKELRRGRDIRQELEDQRIIAMAHSWSSRAEEALMAYKDEEDVVGVAESAGLWHKAVRLKPLGGIKG